MFQETLGMLKMSWGLKNKGKCECKCAFAKIELERRTVIVVNISNRSLPTVTIAEGKESNCSICLTGYGVVREVKGLLCKHMNHSNCIVKWLEIHGFVRQYEMPVDREEKRREDGGAVDGDKTASPATEHAFKK
ncbi:hypothetical protein E3N88_04797 [Mikania micrantha]|uniref:RING-type domain-containing protein n=1 Tax=Mikania micrantha TaxID=192012 RepID=A0A5N6PVF7_9ASTR|nr:hypothetical protein E3N88_04797 [Mikania micrantha]